MACAAPPEVAVGGGVRDRCSPWCSTCHWEVLGSYGKDDTGEDGGVRAHIDLKVGLVSGYRGDFVFISVYTQAERMKYSGDQCFT